MDRTVERQRRLGRAPGHDRRVSAADLRGEASEAETHDQGFRADGLVAGPLSRSGNKVGKFPPHFLARIRARRAGGPGSPKAVPRTGCVRLGAARRIGSEGRRRRARGGAGARRPDSQTSGKQPDEASGAEVQGPSRGRTCCQRRTARRNAARRGGTRPSPRRQLTRWSSAATHGNRSRPKALSRAPDQPLAAAPGLPAARARTTLPESIER